MSYLSSKNIKNLFSKHYHLEKSGELILDRYNLASFEISKLSSQREVSPQHAQSGNYRYYFRDCLNAELFSFFNSFPKDILPKQKMSLEVTWNKDFPPDMSTAYDVQWQGTTFNWNLKNLEKISRFIDYEKDESLWIKIEENNLTFEEICLKSESQKNYVTQVIHLRYHYDSEMRKILITHIDHEFIRYSPNQFRERWNKDCKGSEKQKTFKIDDACIPLDYKNNKGRYFLLSVLESTFNNKELLREYFIQVQQLRSN